MWRVLERMADGRAEKREIDMLLEVTKQVEGHTICALGDAAAWPVQGLIRHFRREIEERIDSYHGERPRRRAADGRGGGVDDADRELEHRRCASVDDQRCGRDNLGASTRWRAMPSFVWRLIGDGNNRCDVARQRDSMMVEHERLATVEQLEHSSGNGHQRFYNRTADGSSWIAHSSCGVEELSALVEPSRG